MASNKPGRRAKDRGFVHDIDLRNDASAAAHLSFVLSGDGRRLNSDADTLRVPVVKRRKASELNAPHSQWNPLENSAEEDVDFEFPVIECDVPSQGAGSKRKRQVRAELLTLGACH